MCVYYICFTFSDVEKLTIESSYKRRQSSYSWWHLPVITALGMLSQEGHKICQHAVLLRYTLILRGKANFWGNI